MQTSVILRRPSFPPTLAAAIAALLLVFALGGVSGYLVKSVTTSAPSAPRAASICPAGTHVAVYYSAGTWACVSKR